MAATRRSARWPRRRRRSGGTASRPCRPPWRGSARPTRSSAPRTWRASRSCARPRTVSAETIGRNAVRLNHSAASPYVRKVMACAIARGLDERIEEVTTNPHESPPALLGVNPLSKVPALLLDDGTALFDSPVICEYLDSLGDARRLFPAAGTPARWRALRE